MAALPLPVPVSLPWSLDRLVLAGPSPLELRDLKGLYRYGDTPYGEELTRAFLQQIEARIREMYIPPFLAA